VPVPAKAAVPVPAKAAVPVPAKAAVPVPAKAAVPVPAKAAVPVPAKAINLLLLPQPFDYDTNAAPFESSSKVVDVKMMDKPKQTKCVAELQFGGYEGSDYAKF
jgi:hypothetical protein